MTSSSSSASSSGEAEQDGAATARGDLGVFVTSFTYATNFLAGKSYDERLAYSDELCKRSARDAGVVRADAYSALLAVGANEAEGDNDATRIQSQASGDGRWCAVRPTPGGPAPNCAGVDVIFATPHEFIDGPTSALLTDERGSYVQPGATSTSFFSGLFLDESKNVHVVNCSGWSVSEEADSGIVVSEPDRKNLFGYGSTEQTARGAPPYEWLTHRDFCLRQRLRLVCVERSR